MSCTRPKYAVQRLKDGKPMEGMSIPDFYNFRESLIITTLYHGNLSEYLKSHVSPDWVEGVDYRPLYLPCGKCAACRLAYGKQWASRGLMEAFCHEKNCFLTLTIDDAHLSEHGPYVRIDYLQKFFKRLRKALGLKKIRYLACGEYGSLNMRPHYHCIIFGYYPDDVAFEKINALGDEIFVSKFLNSKWTFGNIFIGSVTAESIAYVVGYVVKKQEFIDHIQYIGEYRYHLPFITMSRKPGLGYCFFEKYTEDFIHDSIRLNNKSIQVPRYFVKQLEKFCPDVADRLKLSRIQASQRAFNNTHEISRLWHLDELYNLRLSKKERNL